MKILALFGAFASFIVSAICLRLSMESQIRQMVGHVDDYRLLDGFYGWFFLAAAIPAFAVGAFLALRSLR